MIYKSIEYVYIIILMVFGIIHTISRTLRMKNNLKQKYIRVGMPN